jgi:hypothetical protein
MQRLKWEIFSTEAIYDAQFSYMYTVKESTEIKARHGISTLLLNFLCKTIFTFQNSKLLISKCNDCFKN